MLAANFDQEKAKFPYVATPKIDGIRFLMVDGVAVSRTFKPIRNEHIQSILQKHLPDGIDGELTAGNFQESTSAIMTINGKPDFRVWIFDYLDPEWSAIPRYATRMSMLIANHSYRHMPFDHTYLTGINMNNMEELEFYEKKCLEQGYEGIMLRDPEGTYKFGRATVKENILLKVKRFLDDEAVLVRIDEKMSNQNEVGTDAFGHVKRSSALGGMVPMNTTGTLHLRHSDGREIGVGSGLNDALRDEIWKNKEKYIGKLVKYKYFPQGIKTNPRHPVFLGFRSEDDL